MAQNSIAIMVTAPEKEAEAQALSIRLGLPVILNLADKTATYYDYLLIFTSTYLGLQKNREKKSAPFYIDFLSGRLHYRSQQAGLRNELLARAIGFKPKDNPRIIDATAGLGRDSFILASLGFRITLIERSLILYSLLQDAMKRAPHLRAIQYMQLIHADSVTWLKTASLQPDIVYLDPMFPEKKKSASSKKEMTIFQDLLGSCNNQQELFNTALTCAKTRVVVKRPRLAENIAGQNPSFSLTGRSSRFDIYLV